MRRFKLFQRDKEMAEEDNKHSQAEEAPHQLTRREFALGSVAMLGGYSLSVAAALPPLSPEAQAMKLEITEGLRNAMEAIHILEEDVRRVIDHAEKTGQKLYENGSKRYLAKLRINEVYFYAEYSPMEGGFRLHEAYSHRFLLQEDRDA
jgi:hypothetical protein